MMSQHTSAVGEPVGAPPDKLLEVLLGYLAAASWRGWPGTDGMTVRDVVAGVYPAAAAAGYVPAPAVLTRLHADLAGPIRAFFATARDYPAAVC